MNVRRAHNVALAVDIMYINKIPLITTISRAIHFGTIEMIKYERRATVMNIPQQRFQGTTHPRGPAI